MRFKKFFVITLVFALFISLIGLHHDVVKAQTNLNIQAKAAILVDGKTGKILYSQNPDQPLPPASMTKMMTEYLVLEAVNNGQIKLDSVVTASDYAHWMGANGGSRVYLGLGEKRTVEELVYAMAVYSANDATVALAEYIAGTETNFVNLMNKKAKEFGMNNTNFLTSTGFPIDDLGEYAPVVNGDHVMTARDSALLAWHLIHDYPEILGYTSTPMITFRKGESNPLPNLLNWNWMIPGTKRAYEYPGMDGLKTGHTEKAGYNFTGTASKGGVRLISVVFGTTSDGERFIETKKLLDYGFNFFKPLTLVKAKDPLQGFETVEIEKGVEKEVAVIAKNSLEVMAKVGEEEKYTTKVEYNELIEAPIKSGDSLGYISYEYNGQEDFGYLTPELREKNNVDLIAKDDVEKAGFFRLFFRKIISMFQAIFGAIIDGLT